MQDGLFQFSDLTELEQTIFNIKQTIVRPYDKFDRTHMSVSYEMNLDETHIEREVPSTFDLIGDMGGFYDGMQFIVAAFLAIFNYNWYSAYMVSQLFSIEDSKPARKLPKTSRMMQALSQSTVTNLKNEVNNTIDHTKVSSLKMLFFALVPKRCKLSLNTSRLSCLRRDLKY